MVKKNERKLEILKLLDGNEMTSEEIAGECDIALRTAQNHLLRFHKRNLLDRAYGEFTPGKGRESYVYTTNENGRDKVDWLEENFFSEEGKE